MDLFGYLRYIWRARFLRINVKNGHLLFKGERVVLVPAGMFSDLYLGLTEVTGKGGAASALYMGAKKSSPVLFGMAEMMYGQENLKSKETALGLLDDLISLSGYGRCEVVKADLENSEIIIHMRGLLTPSRLEKSDVPVCHSERGAMTGIIEQILGKPCSGKETKCQAMGDDYCEFVITSI